ncbi:TniQ family protein [Pseudoalteromonas phenolica]|uniref:TniQ family protein n=1 Tax=Pseudoalteromonas phenolica TaxID=161398 RepID=UPI00384ACE4C
MEQLQKLLPGEDLFGLLGRSYVMSSFRGFGAMRSEWHLTHYRHLPGVFISRDFKKLIEALKVAPIDFHAKHTCFNMLNSSISQDELEHHCNYSKNVTFNVSISEFEQPWRWCSDCVQADIEEYGISYYHRDHQIPGVNRCLKHNCTLITQCHYCGYKVTQIKKLPIPPVDGRCPDCGCEFESHLSVFTSRMAGVEALCIEMAYGRLKISQQELTRRVQYYLGIQQDDIDLDVARGSIRAFYRDVIDFYGTGDLRVFLPTVKEFKQGLNCPALKGGRVYDQHSTGLPLHPVAIAVIWHFLNEVLTKSNAA